jgi:hypothetical protein
MPGSVASGTLCITDVGSHGNALWIFHTHAHTHTHTHTRTGPTPRLAIWNIEHKRSKLQVFHRIKNVDNCLWQSIKIWENWSVLKIPHYSHFMLRHGFSPTVTLTTTTAILTCSGIFCLWQWPKQLLLAGLYVPDMATSHRHVKL